MDVAITDLRAHLSDWLERASQGTQVVITDRGLPVARLLSLWTTTTIERLTAPGFIGRASHSLRHRPGQRPAGTEPRPHAPAAAAGVWPVAPATAPWAPRRLCGPWPALGTDAAAGPSTRRRPGLEPRCQPHARVRVRRAGPCR